MVSSSGVTQLVRMLRIVEYFQAGEHTLAEAAAEFNMRPASLRQLLDEWGTISHSRGDSLDSVTLDLPQRNDEVVVIERDQGAALVLQPTRQEAALALAACVGAADSAPAEVAPRLRQLAVKLSSRIALPENSFELRIPQLLPLINGTIQARRWAQLRYQPVGKPVRTYLVDPYRVRVQGKMQYLDCWSEDGGWRVFRLDRILQWNELAREHSDHGEPPQFQASLWVQFTISDANRWILDDFPWAQCEPHRSGGERLIRVNTAVSSPQWWVQMWLKYGDLFRSISFCGEPSLIASAQEQMRLSLAAVADNY